MTYRPQIRNYAEPSFSHREQTLFRLVQEGRSIQQIADASMSKQTAEVLIQSVGDKLSSFRLLRCWGLSTGETEIDGKHG
jgi:DNA-binding NarL/FixJ family response regulator